jgi:predicted transcriptional regulator
VKQGYVLDKTTLKISEDIIKQLKHIAIDENKTLTQVIQGSLDEYLQQYKKGGKKI